MRTCAFFMSRIFIILQVSASFFHVTWRFIILQDSAMLSCKFKPACTEPSFLQDLEVCLETPLCLQELYVRSCRFSCMIHTRLCKKTAIPLTLARSLARCLYSLKDSARLTRKFSCKFCRILQACFAWEPSGATSPEIVPGPTVKEKCPDTTRKDRSELRVDG